MADREAARLSLDAITVEARAEYRLAQDAVVRNEQIVDSSRRAAESAMEALQISEVAYRAGATSNIEVVQAQQTARNFETLAAHGRGWAAAGPAGPAGGPRPVPVVAPRAGGAASRE